MYLAELSVLGMSDLLVAFWCKLDLDPGYPGESAYPTDATSKMDFLAGSVTGMKGAPS